MSTTTDIGRTTFSMPNEREVVATRVFDAPPQRLFEAWTSPRHLPHWMVGCEDCTMPICEIDLRPGGVRRSVCRRPDGSEMEISGVFREISPPERLVSAESWGGGWPETLNTLTLTERAGKTIMTNSVLYPSREERDAALGTGMKAGMSQGYDRLDGYLPQMK